MTLKVCVDDDACTKEIKEAISSDLCSRYQSTTIQKLLKVATYLDPRCKSLPFLSDREKNFVVEDLEDYLSALGAHEDLESSNHSEEINKDEDISEVAELSAPPTKKVKKITKLFGDIFKCSQTLQTPLEEIKSELHRYELEEPLDLESDPLKWWLQHHTTYPRISKFIRVVWSLVATSVPSEHVFSVAGNVVNEKRNRLLPENVDKLVFLFENHVNSQ